MNPSASAKFSVMSAEETQPLELEYSSTSTSTDLEHMYYAQCLIDEVYQDFIQEEERSRNAPSVLRTLSVFLLFARRTHTYALRVNNNDPRETIALLLSCINSLKAFGQRLESIIIEHKIDMSPVGITLEDLSATIELLTLEERSYEDDFTQEEEKTLNKLFGAA